MKPSIAAELIEGLAGTGVRTVVKPWGWEYIVQAGDAVIKVIYVADKHQTSLQHHEEKDEVIFILSGAGEVTGTGHGDLRPSVGLRVTPGTVHRSVGPLTLLEISTDQLDDVVRHEDDYGR